MDAIFRSANPSTGKTTAGCFVLAAVVCVAASLGCSPSDGRVIVSGNVTWNGKPLDGGTVVFEPLEPAAAEAGQLTNGTFSLRTLPGEYRVSIRSQKEVGWDDAMKQPRFLQFVPEKYNVETELAATVTEDGENVFSFALEGKEP